MPPPAQRPNVVFILADDMGYGDFARFHPQLQGCPTTPHIESLMDEGVTFTQQYAASCVCNPSRACLLTGRYPHRTGSLDTLEWRGLERLALRETTLADILRAEGYATGLVGKWHLGAFDRRYHPLRRGFDETVCFRGGMHDYYDWRLEAQDSIRRADGRYLTDVWTDEAVAFIERHREEPFFLHVTYNAPHTPLQCPEEDVAPFAETGLFDRGVSILYGMIRRMDAGIGRILETLEACGLRENTLVVFTSDNGPQFGTSTEQGETLSTTRFNCQLHGAKGSTYEGGIRVPLVLRWPAGVEGPREEAAFAHFADWLPTLLSLLQIDRRPELPLDGVDLSSVVRDGTGEGCPQRCWQWNRYDPVVTCNAAIRDGDWKLVRPAVRELMEVPDIEHLHTSMYHPEVFEERGLLITPVEREIPPAPAPELYDLAADPLERRDLAAERPEIVRRLVGRLEAWFEDVEADRQSIDDDWLVQP
jgi:arylsulfatase A